MRYLFLILLLTSCSVQWHCKKCMEGAKVKSDTISQVISVPIEGHEIDSTLQFSGSPVTEADSLEWMNWEATVPTAPVIVRDSANRVEATLQFKKGGKAEVKCNCLPEIKEIKVPVYVETTLQTGYKLIHLIGVGLGVLLIMLAVVFIIAKAR